MGRVTRFELATFGTTNRNSVFKFTETSSGKIYYLKHTDNLDEITRTKRAYEILNGESDIVHTVKVIEDDQDVLLDFAMKNNLSESPGKYWLLTEEVPTSKNVNDLSLDVLRGKPITAEEQKEIMRAIRKLNDGGIVHGDLRPNMFFMREPNGKLRVDLIDYEDFGFDKFADERWMPQIFDDLSRKGLTTIRKKVLPNFDDSIASVKDGKVSSIYITRDNLSDTEWQMLTESLNKEGLKVNKSEFSDKYFTVTKKNSVDNVADAGTKTKTIERSNKKAALSVKSSEVVVR